MDNKKDKSCDILACNFERVKREWRAAFGDEVPDWQVRCLMWGSRKKFAIPSVRALHRRDAEREFGSWDEVICRGVEYVKKFMLPKAKKRLGQDDLFKAVHYLIWGPAIAKAVKGEKLRFGAISSVNEKGFMTFWGWLRENKPPEVTENLFMGFLKKIAKMANE